ncbi:Rossmann-like and DUF2520 domain-containing protein [Christiangramia portivictoriae]|uniref:Rossmann-like and DUF2520 domain-containing protein n=1 Tax=Christiangramia portivictoriae TaxID=326069 RepID=UPI000421F163|nr:Rossmann-like and DUF2520 domain-containing protein [Christiangramia portivictoriae]
MIKVVILGAGNVGIHLYQSFKLTPEVDVIQLFSRNPSRLDFIGNTTEVISDYEQLAEADIYILSVRDSAITEVAQNLKASKALVVHTSGSVAMEDLSMLDNFGIFYPLQTFSKNKEVNFSEIPLCIEANSEENLIKLKELGSLISTKVFEVNSEQRRALHLSAVIVNNFTNHLFTLAADYCNENELPFDILRPLIQETFEKIQDLPPYDAQTGPALRNDINTIETHLQMLNEDRQKIYKTLTDSIQKTHGKKL